LYLVIIYIFRHKDHVIDCNLFVDLLAGTTKMPRKSLAGCKP